MTGVAPKILITGGAGFIGFHLARRLLEHTDATLVLVDNLRRGRLDDELTTLTQRFADRVTVVVADLTVSSAYRTLDRDFDHVFHLAAVNGTKWFYQVPEEVLRINILSLLFLIDWIKETNQKAQLCFTSSNEAYAGALEAFGELPLPTPETVPLVIADPFNPRWSYAGSKLVGEQIIIHNCNALGLRGVIVRPHNFYGPRGGHDHVIPELCLRIATREDPFVLYGPEQTRTFCFIDDAVRALISVMNRPAVGEIGAHVFNIGGQEEVTISQLATILFQIADWSPQAIEERPAPQGSVSRRLPDISRIQTETGWFPAVPLTEGLRATFEWYIANSHVQCN